MWRSVRYQVFRAILAVFTIQGGNRVTNEAVIRDKLNSRHAAAHDFTRHGFLSCVYGVYHLR